jgi:hypothetical protein
VFGVARVCGKGNGSDACNASMQRLTLSVVNGVR